MILLRTGFRGQSRSSSADGLLAITRHGRRAAWVQLGFQVRGDLCCRRKEAASAIQLHRSEPQLAARFRGIQRRHAGVVQDPANGLCIHHWAVSGLQCFKKVDLHGRAANSGPSWRWWSFARNSEHGRRPEGLQQTSCTTPPGPAFATPNRIAFPVRFRLKGETLARQGSSTCLSTNGGTSCAFSLTAGSPNTRYVMSELRLRPAFSNSVNAPW